MTKFHLMMISLTVFTNRAFVPIRLRSQAHYAQGERISGECGLFLDACDSIIMVDPEPLALPYYIQLSYNLVALINLIS
jgi:hypothetical protein